MEIRTLRSLSTKLVNDQSLQKILEKAIEYQKSVFLFFIDMNKLFDRVKLIKNKTYFGYTVPNITFNL